MSCGNPRTTGAMCLGVKDARNKDPEAKAAWLQMGGLDILDKKKPQDHARVHVSMQRLEDFRLRCLGYAMAILGWSRHHSRDGAPSIEAQRSSAASPSVGATSSRGMVIMVFGPRQLSILVYPFKIIWIQNSYSFLLVWHWGTWHLFGVGLCQARSQLTLWRESICINNPFPLLLTPPNTKN